MTCPRAGKLFGGCKFSPRYDLGRPALDGDLQGAAGGVIALVESSKPKTYVRDVCERCGNTVERGSQAAAEGAAGDGISHNPAAGAA